MKIQKYFTFLAVVTLVAISGLLVLNSRRLPSSPAMPSPNGYDDFVKAGQMLTVSLSGGRDLSDYREMNVDQLRVLMLTNAEALRIARSGIDHQCRVPIRYNADWFRAHLTEMLSFKHLAYTFCGTAKLAQLEARTNDVIEIYLDLIRFAHESARGGTIVDNATTRSIEGLGLAGLQGLQNSLDGRQSRQIASTLEVVDGREQPWSEFNNRDITYTWRAEFRTMFSLEFWKQRRRFETRYYEAKRLRQQTMIDFAARAYELEKGQRPKSIADLVPNYLKAIPKDPIAGTNMVLKP